jgi:hypothetical protein
MSKMGSYDPFEYLQHKLWLKEKPDTLTSDHKKLGITLNYVRAGGMPHIVGKS